MSAVLPTAGIAAPKPVSHSFWARLWRDKPLGAVGGVVLLAWRHSKEEQHS